MEQKPVHYDGSSHIQPNESITENNEPFLMTDEMRQNIGKNPYAMQPTE
jgi:hypothetical protein